METLDRATWLRRARAHAERVEVWTRPHLERRRRGERHPVHDFLFDYYSLSPAKLRAWHPGYGVALADAAEYADVKGYAVEAGAAWVEDRARTERARLVRDTRALLVATAGRAPALSCFGLHEWAMVHHAEENGTRHPEPLRLGAGGTDAVVESHRISCSHFDAYRFFTPSARHLNRIDPGADNRTQYEQPGCLHAGMDLYKHAFRLLPLVPSELVADCFALAWDIRILDMRAAPYDLTGLILDPSGREWTPVRIETPEGKREYAEAQRVFAERAAPLRAHLVAECERVLASDAS